MGWGERWIDLDRNYLGLAESETERRALPRVRGAGCAGEGARPAARRASARVIDRMELARRFGTIPGLSDHTLGTTASVAAVALGACLIEKHFTLSRADKGPDSEFSLEPADLERLCRDAKDAWLALGRGGFERQRIEAGNKVFRRSLYIVQDLQPGDVLTPENLRRIRPGYGLPAKYYESLLGKSVKRVVKKGTPARWELLD